MAGAGAVQSAAPAGGEVLPRSKAFLTPGTLETMLQELKVTRGSRIIFEGKNRRAQEMQGLETPKPKASCHDSTVTGYKPCGQSFLAPLWKLCAQGFFLHRLFYEALESTE